MPTSLSEARSELLHSSNFNKSTVDFLTESNMFSAVVAACKAVRSTKEMQSGAEKAGAWIAVQ